jgi:uncharacterized membrane protein
MPDHPIQVRDGHFRSFVKAASWRATGTIDTFILGFLFTRSVKLAGSIASTEVVTKLGLFYLNERIRDRVAWGRSSRQATASAHPIGTEAVA